MPLIRYKTSDIGSFSEENCTCGRPLPLLKSLDGRAGNILIFNGRKIYPSVLSVILECLAGFKECQFIQEDSNRLRMRIVGNKFFSSNDEFSLLNKMSEAVGVGVEIEIDYMEKIPRSRMVKFVFSKNLTHES